MKKFLSLIIAFILAVSAFSICAYADGPQLPDFSETGGEFYITDPDNGTLHLYIKNGKILLEGYAIPLFDEIKIKTNALIDGEYGYIYLTFSLYSILKLLLVKWSISTRTILNKHTLKAITKKSEIQPIMLTNTLLIIYS